ncbi:MAG: hypothetical protein V2I33_25660, partial [Kangiellaceae bacterium]|nr:hypothetical protein [Kangiellaceae bacterium]
GLGLVVHLLMFLLVHVHCMLHFLDLLFKSLSIHSSVLRDVGRNESGIRVGVLVDSGRTQTDVDHGQKEDDSGFHISL